MKKPLLVLSSTLLSVSLLAACSSKPETPTTTEKKPAATQEKETLHSDYVKYKKQIADLKKAIDKYEDINVAIKEGYIAGSGFVPMMGYHFVNPSYTTFEADKPNTLMYTYRDGKYVLVGAEWGTPEKGKVPLDIQGLDWTLGHKASAHYDDGSELDSPSPEESLQTNPETGAKYTGWHPDIYTIHVYTHILNPAGPFETNNPAITDEPPMLPPGFESTFKKKN